MGASPRDLAALVDARIHGVFTRLDAWRIEVETALSLDPRPTAVDQTVSALVLPVLGAADPLLVGAGFIADSDVMSSHGVHFAWWLGPVDDNPVMGATTGTTRLDLTTRGYAEYLRDFRSLEWFRVPATTLRGHVTGPYVDHLCTCDYILTFTSPVRAPDGTLAGVVGADIAVKRLERELLPAFLEAPDPVALVGEHGRVIVSTSSTLPVGALAPEDAPRTACATAPFAIVVAR